MKKTRSILRPTPIVFSYVFFKADMALLLSPIRHRKTALLKLASRTSVSPKFSSASLMASFNSFNFCLFFSSIRFNLDPIIGIFWIWIGSSKFLRSGSKAVEDCDPAIFTWACIDFFKFPNQQLSNYTSRTSYSGRPSKNVHCAKFRSGIFSC
uniref:Uncharacterized protein n=1 Tax=Romanomermis culicivorax TaxID=13658 RepID=A0A915KN23_ROMCU